MGTKRNGKSTRHVNMGGNPNYEVRLKGRFCLMVSTFLELEVDERTDGLVPWLCNTLQKSQDYQ